MLKRLAFALALTVLLMLGLGGTAMAAGPDTRACLHAQGPAAALLAGYCVQHP